MSYCILITLISFSILAAPVSGANEGKQKGEHEIEVAIKGLLFDQEAQAPIVILENKTDKALRPVWIGLCEARSIEIGRSETVTPRPLTYDMMAAVFRTLKANVDKVVIVDLRDQVYYAQVFVSSNGSVSIIDARPSDALALAERMSAPIFVRESVLDKAAVINPEQEKKGI